jgi:chromosome partitioning protein
MGQVIAIASSKGGPGKTTLAQILLGSLAGEVGQVVSIDADPTGTLARWASQTYEGLPITCHHETDEAKLAHLIADTAQSADVVLIDTAGFGNRAAAVAMTSADLVLVPMLPGEADVTEAERTVQLVAGLSTAARREIACRVVLNRMKATTLARHAATEASALPRLKTALSDLVGYGEIGFSGRLPEAGKAQTEIAALLAELQTEGWLPNKIRHTA